jgi:hypothetical protein
MGFFIAEMYVFVAGKLDVGAMYTIAESYN